MIKIAMSPAASALLRVLIARAGFRAIGFYLRMRNQSIGNR